MKPTRVEVPVIVFYGELTVRRDEEFLVWTETTQQALIAARICATAKYEGLSSTL